MSTHRHVGTANPATAFGTLERRSIAVNTANRQIAVGDEAGATAGAPLPLLGVRFFDQRAQYALGDMVVQSGSIWRAKGVIPPGVFNSTQWTNIAGSAISGEAAFVLLDGSRPMTGALSLVPSDPTNADHATRKSYVDAADTAALANANSRVAKAGDVMTGMLTLPATPPTAANHATGKGYVDAADAANATAITAGDSLRVLKGGDVMTGHLSLPTGPAASNAVRKDYVDAANASTSAAITAGDNLRVLKSGDTMSGGLTAPTLAATGAVTAGAGVNFHTGVDAGFKAVADANANILYFNASNYLSYKRSDTVVTFAHQAAAAWTVDANFNTHLPTYVNATKLQLRANGDWNTISIYNTAGSAAGMYLLTGALWFGGATAAGAATGAHWFRVTSVDCQLFGSGGAYKPGGGPWDSTSDERIKTVLGDYISGLEAVKTLHPVRYVFKGNDTPEGVAPSSDPLSRETTVLGGSIPPYANSPHYNAAVAGKEYVGLIAQECEVALPELVTQKNATIDGTPVTDLRNIDSGPLIYALINAVKELAARVEQLEGTP